MSHLDFESAALLFGFGVMMVFLAYFKFIGERCPKCRKIRAGERAGESRSEKDETVYNPQRKGIFDRTKRVTTTTHVTTYRCKHCGHNWTNTGTSRRKLP